MIRQGFYCLLTILCLSAGLAQADEFRLKDGERLFGALLEEAKDRYKIETAGGIRTVKVADVETRIEGEAPLPYVKAKRAALPKDDTQGLVDLMVHAWQHHLDGHAVGLASEVLVLEPDDARAHAIIGSVRAGSGWTAGWRHGGTQLGTVGPRYGPALKKASASYGATSATQAAVRKGLDWLAAHQDEDGRIDADGFMKHDPADDKCDGAGGGHHGERVPCRFDGVTTALAVMAWTGAGSTSVSGPHREQVATGVGFLRRVLGGSNGSFDAIWNHAFALAALCDVYDLERTPDLYPVLERATAALLRTQGPDGGWRYMGGQIGGVPSTSAALYALGMACRARIPVPEDPLKRGLEFLAKRVDRESGRLEYHEGAERLGYTPTVRNAASGLAAWGSLGSFEVVPHGKLVIKAVLAKKPRWKIGFKKLEAPDGTIREFQIGTLDPYSWYYTTLALRQVGGAAWKSWFAPLKSALLKGQRRNGSAKGSWDPLGNYSNSGGRAFVTGMCCLMLEAPYRLPDK